jgi:hypothetical protein
MRVFLAQGTNDGDTDQLCIKILDGIAILATCRTEFLDFGHAIFNPGNSEGAPLKDSSGCFLIEKKLSQALKRTPGRCWRCMEARVVQILTGSSWTVSICILCSTEQARYSYSKNSITLEFTVSCTKSKTVNSATSPKIV